jgi:hypothetical protein
MRPARLLYAAVLAVVVVAVGVVVAVAYQRGEISHSVLRTVPSAPLSVAPGSPSTPLTRAWDSDDHTAIGTPYWGGTVVTFSGHSVRGRDARSGAVTWSYTRDDRDVCEVAQLQGVTIAAFAVNGNCDELTALDSGTGVRKWTRTVDKDGHELNGRPAYAVTPYTLMMTTPSVIYAIDPVSGLDRWLFAQQGCAIHGAVLGSSGALISQSCAHPDCGQKKFCGSGDQLLLRDANAGENTDTASNRGNPDQIKWNLIGNKDRPVSADRVISAAEPGSERLTVLDATEGRTEAVLELDAPAAGSPVAIETARAELLWLGGVTYSIEQTGSDFVWHAATASAPTVTGTNGSPAPDLSAAEVAVAGPGGITLLDPLTGGVSRSFPESRAPSSSRVYPYGSGFLVAGSSTVAYR